MASAKFFEQLLLKLYQYQQGKCTLEEIKNFFKKHNFEPPHDNVFFQVKNYEITLDAAITGIETLVKNQLNLLRRKKENFSLAGVP